MQEYNNIEKQLENDYHHQKEKEILRTERSVSERESSNCQIFSELETSISYSYSLPNACSRRTTRYPEWPWAVSEISYLNNNRSRNEKAIEPPLISTSPFSATFFSPSLVQQSECPHIEKHTKNLSQRWWSCTRHVKHCINVCFWGEREGWDCFLLLFFAGFVSFRFYWVEPLGLAL